MCYSHIEKSLEATAETENARLKLELDDAISVTNTLRKENERLAAIPVISPGQETLDTLIRSKDELRQDYEQMKGSYEALCNCQINF